MHHTLSVHASYTLCRRYDKIIKCVQQSGHGLCTRASENQLDSDDVNELLALCGSTTEEVGYHMTIA